MEANVERIGGLGHDSDYECKDRESADGDHRWATGSPSFLADPLLAADLVGMAASVANGVLNRIRSVGL